MSKKIKKYVLPYFPYLIAFWFFSKCGTAYRMAAGANLGEKLFGMVKTIGPVFQSYAPGLGLFDLAVGVAGAVILYFVVQSKIKKARKFRRDKPVFMAAPSLPVQRDGIIRHAGGDALTLEHLQEPGPVMLLRQAFE